MDNRNKELAKYQKHGRAARIIGWIMIIASILLAALIFAVMKLRPILSQAETVVSFVMCAFVMGFGLFILSLSGRLRGSIARYEEALMRKKGLEDDGGLETEGEKPAPTEIVAKPEKSEEN